jgi:propionyl-CoA synthetase
MGRVDDIINVAGHRLSTGSMEEVVAKHPDVAECAVIGIDDQLKGQVPIGFAVLKAGVSRNQADIQKEIVGMIRDQIGALACLKDIAIVVRLPKTRSGKILRSTMRKIADGKEYNVPSTIEDPAMLGEIQGALKDIGYPKQ